jgi:hypothetical protein
MSKVYRVGLVAVIVMIVAVSGALAQQTNAAVPVTPAVTTAAPASTPAVAEKEAVRAGFDLRLRQEKFNYIPLKPGVVTRGGYNDYFRIRPRIWGEVDLLENVIFRARVVNEFRHWNHPDMNPAAQRSSYNFEDEYVFDNLYIEAKDLADKKLDIKVGRQEMIYGTGKLILEGTPKDGSRTIYFNAAKAVWKGIPNTTVDLVGIYNESIDRIAINPADRDLTGVDKNNDNITESGAFVYLKNKSCKSLPCEVYAIWKNESKWVKQATASTTVDVAALNVGTYGFRIMPNFGSGFSGNLEAAYQSGKRGDVDTSGEMLDASVAFQCPVSTNAKPTLDLGVYYLSGDKASSTDEDESWNPLWARYPQYSELYVYAWDAEAAGRWANVTMPKATFSVNCCKYAKTTAMVAYMWANEADGAGGGKDRGWLYVAKTEFDLGGGYLSKTDKLSAHLWLEMLDPGNYYPANMATAYFARWEVMYSF